MILTYVSSPLSPFILASFGLILTLFFHSQTETCVGFEGPEKKLEIRFRIDNPKGLRQVSQARWQEILDAVKCTIMSCTKNEYLDSYVLSESSLFVYPNKVLIKTCGTTTLLHCVSGIQVLAKEYNAEIDMIIFSRKNLNFPTRQLYPHNNFDDEVCILNLLCFYFYKNVLCCTPLTIIHRFIS